MLNEGPLILVVEDEEHVSELVVETLRAAGFRTRASVDGEDGVRQATLYPPDLVVMDVGLPGIDGWETSRRLRLRAGLPILFLTALDDDEHVVRGLGVDDADYLTKPFSPPVLIARVQALLRRGSVQSEPEVVQLVGLTINLRAAEVRRGNVRLHLTATEFKLLAVLARRLDNVISARDLIRAVQGYDITDGEAQDLVKVHIRNLRLKIEPEVERPRYILSVRGLGYTLNRALVQDIR